MNGTGQYRMEQYVKAVLEPHFGICPSELKYFEFCRRKHDGIVVELVPKLSGLAAVKTALETTANNLDMRITSINESRNYLINYEGKTIAKLKQGQEERNYEITKCCDLYFPNYLDNIKNRKMHRLQIDFLKEFDKNLCEIFKP